jgi:branched-chain amino acid transport system ATP-binding protein
MTALLSTENLTLAFGGLVVANGIDFELVAGERLAVIGQNGAGKTTFINLCTGLLKPNAGRVSFDGADITGHSPRAIVRRGMARSFQLPQLFLEHSVRQCLELAGMARAPRLPWWKPLSASADARSVEHTLALVGLAHRQHEPVANLPEGQRKLLDVAMSLMLQPRLLIMDEPTSGVSTEEKHGVMDIVMKALDERQVTAIFVEHDVDIVRRYATRVAAWISGAIAADGPPEDVLGNAQVRREVLGE